MDATTILFWIFASISCAAAVAVVATQNVVRMAFWLIVSLGSVAGLYFLLSADFVAATQLLIYVGGTLVLLIFGVMLTATGPYSQIRTSPGEALLAAGVGSLFLAMIITTVVSVDWDSLAAIQQQDPSYASYAHEPGFNPAEEGNTARPLGLKMLGISLEDLGRTDGSLSHGYLLPFEIVSIHLLVVLIGASYLARAKRRSRPDQPS